MHSLLPTRHKHSRKLSSIDAGFQTTHYSDTAFNPPQFLLTKNSKSSSKGHPKQRYLKTQASQPLRKWVYSRVDTSLRQQKVKLLTSIRSICRQYQQQKEISQKMCERIYGVLDNLVRQESTYGRDMQEFFEILKRLIFCENEGLKENIEELGKMEVQPYNYLIMNVIERKYLEVMARSREIDELIQQMNERIGEIDKRYQEKMKVLTIQNTNSTTALRIEHQTEIFQLNLKISLLKDTVESYERSFRKAGLDIPPGKTSHDVMAASKGLKRKKEQKMEIEEVEMEIS